MADNGKGIRSIEFFFEMRKKQKKNVMITEYIEQNKITLIHGESGSGKTIFAIKHLNKNNIEPTLLDFDDNYEDELAKLGCKVEGIADGDLFFDELIRNKVDDDGTNKIALFLKDKVVIIDTWRLFSNHIKDEHKAIDILNLLTDKYNVTIILLAHTEQFSGKNDEPDMSRDIYSHIKGRLYIRKIMLTNSIKYDLIIEKLRGYIGPKIINIREEKR
jgi:archaellum biogenesis ATPase FlaH